MDSFFIEGLLATLTFVMRAVCIIVILGVGTLLVTAVLVELGFVDPAPSTEQKAAREQQRRLDEHYRETEHRQRIIFRDGHVIDPKTPEHARVHRARPRGVRAS